MLGFVCIFQSVKELWGVCVLRNGDISKSCFFIWNRGWEGCFSFAGASAPASLVSLSFGWRWCMQHQCCLGAGEGQGGSALCSEPYSPALISPEEAAVGCLLHGRAGRTGLWAVKEADEQFQLVSVLLAYLSMYFQRGLRICLTSVIKSSSSH